MELHGKNIIAGQLSAESMQTFGAVDPAAGSRLEPLFYEATESEVDRALAAAEAAFEECRRLPAERVAAFLDGIAEEIAGLGDALIQRAHAETALPQARLTGERARTTGQLRMFAGLIREGSWVEARIDHAIPDRQPAPKPDLRRMLIPMGPVVVFGASNFPFAFSVAGGDTASAVAAGNPVVVKAHPAHPGTSELVAGAIGRAAAAAGLPAGIFSMLHGGPAIGLALVRHPLTRAVGFTGSLKAGRALFDAAAARESPIPVYAEMGSVNPVFILPGAMRERGDALAEGLKQSVTLGVGQFCTNPGLVVALNDSNLERFTRATAEKVKQSTPGTMLYDSLCEAYGSGVARLRETANVRLEAVSESAADPAKAQAAAAVFSTTAATLLADPRLEEELFGPSTLIVRCGSPAEMVAVARGLEGQLTATIHGTPEDLEQYRSLVSVLENKVGRLIFNGFPTGVEVCPSMHHGGPYPATTDVRSTSVGTAAIQRFARPLCYQDFPQDLLPPELQDSNPRGIWRLVDGEWTR